MILFIFAVGDKQALYLRLYVRPLDQKVDLSGLIRFVKNPSRDPVGVSPQLREYIAYFEKIKGMYPGEINTDILLGYLYYHAGDKEKAKTLWRDVLSVQPWSFWANYNLGVIAFREQDYVKATGFMATALSVHPDVILNEIMLSGVYRKILNVRDFDLNLPLRQQQAYADAYALAILSEYHLKRYPEMYQIAQAALRIKFCRDKQDFDYYAGVALLGLGKLQEAESFFEKSLMRSEGDVRSYYYLAKIFEAAGARDKARAMLQAGDALSAKRGGQESFSVQKIGVQFF